MMRVLAAGVVIAALFASGLGLVHVKYENRKLYSEWQQLVSERDEMNVEWGRLQLELSTWATHPRIERLARERLDMKIPDSDEVVIIREH